MPKRFMEEPIRPTVPKVLRIDKDMLLEAVNRARTAEHLDPIHIGSCTVVVTIPQGGEHYGGEEIEIGRRDNGTLIEIRFEGEI